MFTMPPKCLMSEWLSISFYLVLLFCCCVRSFDSTLKQDALSPHVSTENLKKDINSSYVKKDDPEPRKFSKEHATVPRKGVPVFEDIPESCNTSSSKGQSSPNCAPKSVVSKNNTVDGNSSNISHISSSNSKKNMTAAAKEVDNQTTATTTSKPVMKPLYTSDDYSSADYNETGNLYSYNSNWLLSAFSLSLFIVFLVILIFVLFYKLKYKFSVQQNYRRVDYLIDGMYID